MYNGGPVTLVYGFLFCWASALVTGASLAEMASMAPTSGGQYHWVTSLSPPKYSVFLSWFTGWVATLGWQANVAAGVFFSSTILQGLLVLNYPSYVFERWHGTLLLYAALLLCVLVNTVAARLLPKIEGFIMILHILGFFAILIPLVYMAPHSSTSFVFKDFINTGGWSSPGTAWLVGLISSNLPFIGYDGPCHMAEEVQDASIIVPWCMMGTIVINGLLGFAVVLTFSFCVGDLQTALTSPTGYDFIEVFYNATNSRVGATIMTAVIITLVICASFGFLASASRQTWAFARDHGLPFSPFLAHVKKRFAIPLRAIAFSSVAVALIGLINIGSSVAFDAIVSLTISGDFTSYLIPIVLLIFKRLNGEQVHWGPWRLGPSGLYINILSACFLIISICFSFFPPALPVTPVSMNWSIVMFGGTVLLGMAYYVAYGRKVYNGPVVERPIIVTREGDF
ncbi:hypothetical protein MMC14_005265 [Varicellaria rhodocarpa]|nr:hypothetical protein [Varicellaria rhodocarpa]